MRISEICIESDHNTWFDRSITSHALQIEIMEKKEHSIRYRNNKYLYTCRDYFHDLPEYHRKLSLSQLQMREEFKIMERKYGT